MRRGVPPSAEPTVDLSYFLTRISDLAKPYEPPACGVLRDAFPLANRGAELRKFHLKGFLTKQQEAEVPFGTSVRDFQLLLHASGVLPLPTVLKLCEALVTEREAKSKAVREEAAAAIAAAQRALFAHAGLAA